MYDLAVHDIRRAIEKMAPDDALMAYILKRLARAFDEAWRDQQPKAASD